MKKIILLGLFVLFLVSGLFAVSDSLEIKKTIFYYKNVDPPYPLFKKVFPGVNFIIKFDRSRSTISKSYLAEYKNKYYYPVTEYSNLFEQVKEKSKATLFERLKLLIQLYHDGWTDSVFVSDLKPLNQKEKEKLKKLVITDYGYNYQMKVKIYNTSWRDPYREVKAYIKIKNNIIEYIGFVDKKGYGGGVIAPFYLNKLDIKKCVTKN